MIRRIAILAMLGVNAFAQNWPVNLVPVFGHRNWIVIADSAYPDQSAPGIETVRVDGDPVAIIREVLKSLENWQHVRPVVYLDEELKFVPEEQFPALAPYRASLEDLFRNQETHSLLHEDIIRKLDETSKTFKVLIIKTRMKIPYTSVFLQLDCGYWSPESEKALREAMAKARQ